jgi:8-amino-7-oxononanoate synthase
VRIQLSQRLNDLRESGLLREARTIRPSANGWCEVDGQLLRNFASNDYLNLAHDDRVIAAAREALDEYGVGARASALVCGRSEWHSQLERRLAEFEGTESAILFPTGYAANTGTLSALIEPSDTVFCDRFNHASLVDGIRLSRARLRVYRRDRLDALQRELMSADTTGHKWIVTDAVFSMDGDLAPLSEICDLADQSGADVIVDEAHATGVFGPTGRGVCELTGTEDRVAVRIGTLSKAVGTQGGFVAGSSELIEWLRNSARTQVYSTALPPAVCAAAVRSLELIQSEPERRIRLFQLSDLLRAELRRFDLNLLEQSRGPVIPLVLGDPNEAIHAARLVEQQRFLVAGIRPPTVPQGTSRLRVSVTTAFNEQDIRALAVAITRAVSELTMQQKT